MLLIIVVLVWIVVFVILGQQVFIEIGVREVLCIFLINGNIWFVLICGEIFLQLGCVDWLLMFKILVFVFSR